MSAEGAAKCCAGSVMSWQDVTTRQEKGCNKFMRCTLTGPTMRSALGPSYTYTRFAIIFLKLAEKRLVEPAAAAAA